VTKQDGPTLDPPTPTPTAPPAATSTAVPDEDFDGTLDAADTCANQSNPSQVDLDGDGLGDACDICPDLPMIAENHRDRDGDGEPTCAGDCDDANPARSHGLAERCDAIDNDCDLQVDEACDDSIDAGVERVECADGIDNDGDGRVDLEDPGCAGADDDREQEPAPGGGVCDDGQDNDLDGTVDFPDDGDCDGPDDPSEAGPACPVQGAVGYIPPFGGQMLLSVAGGERVHMGSCGGNGQEQALFLNLLVDADLTFETSRTDELFFPAIYLRSDCDDPESELACAHRNVAQHDARIEVRNVPAGRYWLFVDDSFGRGGWTTVIVTVQAR
jgi:hypothetical protein